MRKIGTDVLCTKSGVRALMQRFQSLHGNLQIARNGDRCAQKN